MQVKSDGDRSGCSHVSGLLFVRQMAGKAAAVIAKVRDAAREAAQLDFFARFKEPDSDREIDLPVDVGHDTMWATQAKMAELFGVNIPSISRQISNIYDDGELTREATVSKIETVRIEGDRQVTREVDHFNLDIILAVGYRVSSKKATAFRQWATRVLKGYVEEGYALNGARLRSDPDALQRLAEQVRLIRTSERALYRKVRDTFAACAIDYDPNSQEARTFFAYTQDALHYAVSEHTAAQIILTRADGTKPNMGMVGLGNKAPTFEDAKVAKNYMERDELRSLELLGEAWLIYAESIVHRGKQASMARLLAKVNELILANEYTAFPGYDKLNSSRPVANEHAKRQLAIYKQKTISERMKE